MPPSLAALRAFALRRSLPGKAGLQDVIDALGYVQADPIRAPARAQDLILFQRVRGYRAGDLERRYADLDVEEEVLQNYGFVPRRVQRLVHPREVEALRIEREAPHLPSGVLSFVSERGAAHPREVEAHFGRERVGNYWGGTSSATTRVLEGLHFRGHLRVVRRENGVRVYGPARHLADVHADPLPKVERARGLVDLVLRQLAPMPEASLKATVSMLGYGARHLAPELREAVRTVDAERVKVDGVTYVWPRGETLDGDAPPRVHLVAPFDPLVWDRRRFEHLHGWAYRFEAYTPPAKRRLGYYALPLLWRGEAIGWANLKVDGGDLKADVGFVNARPASSAFERELDAELARYRAFLGLT